MADTATSALTAIAGTAVADADTMPIADATATATKSITPPELMIAMQLQGATKFVFGAPSDASVKAGTGVFYVDTTTSPLTFKVKVRDTASPEVVTIFTLG